MKEIYIWAIDTTIVFIALNSEYLLLNASHDYSWVLCYDAHTLLEEEEGDHIFDDIHYIMTKERYTNAFLYQGFVLLSSLNIMEMVAKYNLKLEDITKM